MGDGVAVLDIRLVYMVENLIWFMPLMAGTASPTLL